MGQTMAVNRVPIKKVIFRIFNSSVAALILALFVSGMIMLFCGYNPIEAYRAIFQGAFAGKRAWIQTLIQATPLIFTGLAYTVARKASLINLGIEGQLYMGALGAACVGLLPLNLPSFIWLLASLLGAMAAGALYAGLVGFMKVKFGSNEVIATMMLNTVAVNVVAYLVNYPLKAEGSLAQTVKLPAQVLLPRLAGKYQLTIAIFIAAAACFLIKFFMGRTVAGYEIRSVGLNPRAAETAGIRIGRVLIMAMMLSGCIAGLAGGSHVLGMDRRLIAGFSSGYGFDGIAVAALAAENPAAVIIAGIVFGALRAGCMVLNRTTSIPTEFVDVIQALVIIFVAAPALVRELSFRKNGRKEEVKA